MEQVYFYLAPTPHNTVRLFITLGALPSNVLSLLTELSIWHGPDKNGVGWVSFEYELYTLHLLDSYLHRKGFIEDSTKF